MMAAPEMVSKVGRGEITLLREGFSTLLGVLKPTKDGPFGKGLPCLGSRFQKAFYHLFLLWSLS